MDGSTTELLEMILVEKKCPDCGEKLVQNKDSKHILCMNSYPVCSFIYYNGHEKQVYWVNNKIPEKEKSEIKEIPLTSSTVSAYSKH